MRRSLVTLLALAAPVALLAACGDDDSGADPEHVAAWTANLTEDDDGLAVSEDDARCMAEALVERIGTDVFEDNDVTVEDIEGGASPGELLGDGAISEDDARAVLDEWGDCADLSDLLARSSAEGLGLEGDAVACLADAIDEEDLAETLLVSSFTTEDGQPDQDALGRFTVLADECSTGDGGGGGALAESIAESLRADGTLDEAQSTCLAQAIIDTIGRDRLVEMSLGAGSFEDAPAEFQQEMGQAILGAADECGVPLSALDG